MAPLSRGRWRTYNTSKASIDLGRSGADPTGMTGNTLMISRAKFGLATLSTVALVALPLVVTAAHGQAGPFHGLAGSWSGTGTITTSAGTERLRCRVRYAIGEGGAVLQQELRCASDSYRFDVSSTVSSRGAGISGTWTETNRNVSGNVSGTARPGLIQARVDGVGFTAGLSISTSGSSQSVQIRPSGGDIQAVAVTLHRG
jgi:hypothetical protein